MQNAEHTSFCHLKKPTLNLNPRNTNSFIEYVDEHVHIGRPSNVRTIPAESPTAASTPKSWLWVNLKIILDQLYFHQQRTSQSRLRAKDNNLQGGLDIVGEHNICLKLAPCVIREQDVLVATRAQHRHHHVRDQQCQQPIRLVKSISIVFPTNAVGHPSRANRIASFSLVLRGEFVLCLVIGTLANCCFFVGIRASDLDRLLPHRVPRPAQNQEPPEPSTTSSALLELQAQLPETQSSPVMSVRRVLEPLMPSSEKSAW
ncbi:hypothetical protein PILCRDRAFT_15865 [Piloderma croceum F 1598]|uniref:Uncharacterized protein n=1 Tax=Piloderma croceum (strain F 1598) TaxID=765440 RepID=A0A0C3EXP8_PILCF|nr:hypothetical protein PILCRDRAFT_15865 [Piloderma croceum F 1598]